MHINLQFFFFFKWYFSKKAGNNSVEQFSLIVTSFGCSLMNFPDFNQKSFKSS